MTHADPPSGEALARLADDRPLVAVELRPPRRGISRVQSIDVWIDMHHAMGRLGRRDTVIFLTDSAVGEAEEENLRHLSENLPPEVDRSRVVPFLTCKHSLEYCHLYAERAAAHGFEAITVLGGDREVGPPRCVAHASELRRSIRRRLPSLRLGGWVNPHRDPEGQVDLLLDPAFEVDFFLTQIVSHHRLDGVERFLAEARSRGVDTPGAFGVFFYRSARAETLRRLSGYFPVPVEEIVRDFENGRSPVDICASTIRALREAGVTKVYVSNLGLGNLDRLYDQLLEALEG